jgi:hypothetical protein
MKNKQTHTILYFDHLTEERYRERERKKSLFQNDNFKSSA